MDEKVAYKPLLCMDENTRYPSFIWFRLTLLSNVEIFWNLCPNAPQDLFKIFWNPLPQKKNRKKSIFFTWSGAVFSGYLVFFKYQSVPDRVVFFPNFGSHWLPRGGGGLGFPVNFSPLKNRRFLVSREI